MHMPASQSDAAIEPVTETVFPVRHRTSGFGGMVPDEKGQFVRYDDVKAALQAAAVVPELIEVLKLTASNIRHLPAFSQHGTVYEPYTVWLKRIEDAIAEAELETTR